MKILLLISLIFPAIFCSNLFNLNLIKDYLNEKYLKICIVLSCEMENLKTLKFIQNNGFWTSVENISEDIDWKYLAKRLQYQNYYVGIVGNLDCPKINDILQISSENMLFRNHYAWLLFGSDINSAKKMLKHRNININSDVNLAILQSNNKMYCIIKYV